MKKLVLTLVILFALTGVLYANPLTDYSQGNTSIDINWRPNLTMDNPWNGGGHWKGDGKSSNYDVTITTGLGNKFAIQYGQFNPRSKNANGSSNTWFGMDTQEFNVLYQLDKNVSAFAGYHRAKYTASYNSGASDKNTFQGGLIGYTKIADKTNLYGMIGVGSGLVNYEAGVSYDVAKNTEFNLSYRYKKVKGLAETNLNLIDDVTAKGIGYGLTFKF